MSTLDAQFSEDPAPGKMRETPPVFRRAAFGAELTLAMVLAVIAARLVWTIITPDAFSPHVNAAPGDARAVVQARGAQDWSVLWRFDPFNRSAVAASAQVEDAPETTLNLKLNGVRAGFEGADGVAYVTLPDNTQGAFREGESLLDGVTLERVFPDRVIIRRNGVPESLYLDGGRKPFGGQAASADSERVQAPRTVDVGGLLGSVSLAPAFEGARFQGFRIESADAALLGQYQLRNGDVLESVDGQRLTQDGDPAALAQLFEQQGEIELTISRDGDRLTRRIQLGDETE